MRTINRILVANRGEIALRVCRTATDMGIATIAVYADQDMAAPHTREADEALSLGGDDAASTYLNGDKILAIALETGADATASCPKTPNLRAPSKTPASRGSAPPPPSSTPWATRSTPDASPRRAASPPCPASPSP